MKRGFTLIELLVVIAIIGLLSSIVLASLANAKERANDARRLSDLKDIQNALELYYTSHGAYPTNPVGTFWSSTCSAYGALGANSWIPGLSPEFISTLPNDPEVNTTNNTCCYLYGNNSIGKGYKLLIGYACGAHISSQTYADYPVYIDPDRDGGTNNAIVDWNGTYNLYDWAVYTPDYAAN